MSATHDVHSLTPHATRRRHDPPAAPMPTVERRTAAPATPLALLADARLSGHGHAPLRQAAVQRLQQTIGNQATRRFLQRNAAPPSATAPPPVQRYNIASLNSSKAIAWSQETVTAKKSAAGVSGGVYFMTSAGGMLVVKPEVGGIHPPEQTKFADKFLAKGMDIKAPTSKIVDAAGTEGQDITQAILAKLVIPPGQDPAAFRQAVTDDLNQTTFYKVMNPFHGESVSGLAKGADTQTKVDAFITRLENETILRRIGKLMAADAFMNNPDRMNLANMNLGNIMIAHDANKIYTLDSEALLPELKDTMNPAMIRQKLVGGFDLINGVFDKAGAIFQGFVDTILNMIPQTATFDGKAHFQANFNHNYGLAMLRKGINDGVETFRKMGSNTGDLKKEAGILYMPRQQGTSSRTSWATLKINQFYTDLRARGLPADKATKFAEELAQFRLDRAKLTSKYDRAQASKQFKKEIKIRIDLALSNK